MIKSFTATMLDEITICWTLVMAKPREIESAKRQGAQVEAVIAAAQQSGLLREKSGRIGGRVSPALVERAKARTGIEADTDLIEFALANIALEDRFSESFKAVRGKVDPDLNLGF